MARLKRFEPVYETFETFLQRCVLDDRSLLWPRETAWTVENVSSLKRQLIGTPIEGTDLNFEEKLELQMKSASREQWVILGDVYYVYMLVSSYFKLSGRVERLRWVIERGGLDDLDFEDDLWQVAQTSGFTRTGQRYHRKYGQFWHLLMFAESVKESDDPHELIDDSVELQALLDGLLEEIEYAPDRAQDMRHALLYMTHPDDYERIISGGDKGKIIKFYGSRITEVPDDPDEAIRQIRAVLSRDFDGDEPFDFYDDLGSEWRDGRAPVVGGRSGGDGSLKKTKNPVLVERVLRALNRTRNIVLYGPPGTGKTYLTKKVADQMLSSQERAGISREARLLEIVEDKDFQYSDALAIAIYTLGKTVNLFGEDSAHSLNTIMQHEVVKAKVLERAYTHPKSYASTVLGRHTSNESELVLVKQYVPPFIFDRDESSRWYLTDKGKKYVENELKEKLDKYESLSTSKAANVQEVSERFVEWTTFHQSYSYEDFVEGLRPVVDDETNDVKYEVVDGVFRRLCKRAAADPENKYMLVIDEVNRGNISKVFGELMTLLEDDKRAGEPNALSVTLPYSTDAFSVPENVYLVATMNTADRSIALLDVALRRRFAFIEVMPDAQLLENAEVTQDGISIDLTHLLSALNAAIRRDLDRDHQIGHSYLMTVKNASADERLLELEFAWNNRILPLLEEYYHAQPDELYALLSDFLDEEKRKEALGGDFSVDAARAEGSDLIAALNTFVGSQD